MSSRSSTSSDIDSLFPQRLGHSLYISDDGSKKGVEDEVVGDDGEGEFLEVDGDDEEIVERRAVCVFDFTAECEGEISIETGQVIWVEFRKGVSGWLVVRDEITGGFPTLLSPLSPLPPPPGFYPVLCRNLTLCRYLVEAVLIYLLKRVKGWFRRVTYGF